MDHSLLLERFTQCQGERLGHLQRSGYRQRSRLPDLRLQTPAVDVLHDDETMPGGLAAVEHAHDGRVIQSRGQSGLAEEPLGTGRLLDQMGVQELDRHIQVQVLVMPLVDHTHAAFTKTLKNLAVANAGELQIGIIQHAGPRLHPE